jgi:hypothetical protein
MENIKAPETKAELLELLEKLNEVAGDVLTQLKQWDIILQEHHNR